MLRAQLEHIIRASAGISGESDFIVIGSQAVLGQFPDAPPELLESIEADIFSPREASVSDLIEGSIGEGSPFHRTFGYYAHGVGERTATLPAGWRERLVPVSNPNTGAGTGHCLEVHDLAVAKLVAGRDKDLAFLGALVRHSMVDLEVVRKRLAETVLDRNTRAVCLTRLKGLVR